MVSPAILLQSFIWFSLTATGICQQQWDVRYSKTVICALKGSTINLSGSYKHPEDVTVKETFWIVNPSRGKAINLLDLPEYEGRVKYFQTDTSSFLKLSDVRHEDRGMYCLKILANPKKENFLGFPGIEFRVTELKVEIPEEVVEGDSPVLTCKSTCTLTGSTNFTWYKNGEPFSDWTGENQLFLKSVSSEDTGNYSCGVRDQKHLSSPALTLNVRYPPKSVSVSISGSGDSVTMSCISDSNPPALIFRWFKEDQSSAVGSGQSFGALQSGRYYCEAHNPHGESVSSCILITVGITAAAFVMLVILIVFIWIRRKRVTLSEEQNYRGAVESPEDTYMTLDPKSRSSEYDTLDNMKTSCENTDSHEEQDPSYYNIKD